MNLQNIENLNVEGMVLLNNTSSNQDGGAIEVLGGKNLTFSDLFLARNIAKENGGGVSIKLGENVTLSNFTIKSNNADLGGALLLNSINNLYLNSFVMDQNKAVRGTLYSDNC